MPRATLTSKGRITLPREVREQLHVQSGDAVVFVIGADGVIRVRADSGDVSELRGILHRPGRRAFSLRQMDEAMRKAHKEPR